MKKSDIPWLIGGGILFIVFFGTIGAEVGGFATKEQVGQAITLSLVPAYGGFIFSGLIWLRSRRHQGPTLLTL